MSNRTDAPELIDLPVYRDDYISQQQVDLLCRILWDEKPWYIRDLAAEENAGRRKSPTKIQTLWKVFSRMGTFFRELESNDPRIEKISYLGMVDLVYEVERRVRIALGLEDFKPVGYPIAPSPEGPFPEVGDVLFHILKDEDYYREYPGCKDKVEPTFYPESNKVYQKLCEEHPDVLFAFAEGIRRCQISLEKNRFIDEFEKRHLPEDEVEN